MTTIVVSTTAQLEAALKTAASGDTVALAAGTYSGISISSLDTGGGVTVTSADPSNLATLTDLSISKSSGITFSHLTLSTATDPAAASGASVTFPFLVNGSSAINFDSVSVAGSAAGSLSTTVSGIYIRNSSDCAVTNSSFSYLQNALSDSNDTGITFSNNTFADIYGDGIDSSGTSNIAISNNSFTNMYIDPTNPQHPDCIQFWTTNTTTSASNISVTDNTYIRGPTGNPMQFIFITDQIGNLPYQNVTVTGNVATGALYDAIYIVHTNGVVVQNNIITAYPDRLSEILLTDSNNGQITNNVAPKFVIADDTNTTASGNVVNAVVNYGGASNPNPATVTPPVANATDTDSDNDTDTDTAATVATPVVSTTAPTSAASFASVLTANMVISAAMGGGYWRGVDDRQSGSRRFAFAVDTRSRGPTRSLEPRHYGAGVTAVADFRTLAMDFGMAGPARSGMAAFPSSVPFDWRGRSFGSPVVIGARATAFASAIAMFGGGNAALATTSSWPNTSVLATMARPCGLSEGHPAGRPFERY